MSANGTTKPTPTNALRSALKKASAESAPFDVILTLRVSSLTVERIDKLAEKYGMDRSTTIRTLLDVALDEAS